MVFLNLSRKLSEESTDIKLGNDSFIYLYFLNDVIGISDNLASNDRSVRTNKQ